MEHPDLADRFDIGRVIGHDLYCRSRSLPRDAWPPPVREGFVAASAGGAARQLPDRYLRKWLQLRLSTFERELVINDDVTPGLLRLIDVDCCPVTRMPLTHSELRGSDWSIDRLNNDGAYAANNLAVMSRGVNRIKGGSSYEAVYERSQRELASHGLSPVEWLRLAAMMLGPCFATRPGMAPVIPLAAPIPNRALRPAVQQIQHVFTRWARQQAGKNALIKHFKLTSSTPTSTLRLRCFAEAMHQGLKGLANSHDVWLVPGVMDAFLGWRHSMEDLSWAMAGEISRQLAGGLVVAPSRLSSWHLSQRGYQNPCRI